MVWGCISMLKTKQQNTSVTKPAFATEPSAQHSLFLDNVLQIIEDKQLTLDSLAQESGLDKKLLSQLVQGTIRPSRSVLQCLSVAPSVRVSYKKLVTWCLLDDSLQYASVNGTPVC